MGLGLSPSRWPESRTYIQDNLGHLPDSLQRKLVCENAGALYEFT